MPVVNQDTVVRLSLGPWIISILYCDVHVGVLTQRNNSESLIQSFLACKTLCYPGSPSIFTNPRWEGRCAISHLTDKESEVRLRGEVQLLSQVSWCSMPGSTRIEFLLQKLSLTAHCTIKWKQMWLFIELGISLGTTELQNQNCTVTKEGRREGG